MPKRTINVVTIGGGKGQSTVLRGLRTYPLHLTAVVSMVDNGGSTGELCEQLGVMPMGDVRRCLGALSGDPKTWEAFLEDRHSIPGHPIGNLILAGLELKLGSADKAIQQLAKWLKLKATVLPVTNKHSVLHAELMNDDIVKGETNIDIPVQKRRSPISKVYLKPPVKALPSVLKAIRQADIVIFTIGDLYTSVLPNVLVGGMAQALRSTKAKLVYTCNRTTKVGETSHYTALDYAQTLERYIGRKLTDIIVDQSIHHDGITSDLVYYTKDALEVEGITVHEANLKSKNPRSIDGTKLAKAIWKVCQQSF